MRKDRTKALLSSIFSAHIGHEHSEVIEGKEEIEKKFDKILMLIKAEDKNGNDLETGSELGSLVEEFYEQYNALYGKYDSLVEKLKKHSHHKEMNGDVSAVAISSGSDSSSSDSDKDNETKLVEESISLQEFHDMRMQIEVLGKRNQELEYEATSMHSTISKYKDQINRMTREESDIAELKEEMGLIKESKSNLEAAHEGIKKELESVMLQHSSVSDRLTTVHEEKEILLEEKLRAENAVQEVKSEKSSLEAGYFKLQNENQILQQEHENLCKQVADLNGQLAILNVEKDNLSSEHARDSAHRDAVYESLRQELEALYLQHSNVSLTLANAHKEKEALLLEKLHAENVVVEVKSDKDLLEEAHIKLQNENQILKQDVENSKKQLADLNGHIVILCEEKDNLSVEYAHESARRDAIHERLMQELEALKLQHSDVNLRLVSAHKDKEALLLEKLHAEGAVKDVKSEKEVLEEAHFKLQNENQFLKQDLEDMSKQVEDLNGQIVILNAEKDNLSLQHAHESACREVVLESLEQELADLKMQNSDMSLRLTNSHKEKDALLSEKLHVENTVQELKSEKSLLEEAHFKLGNENQILRQELESSANQVADLKGQLIILNKEKDNLRLEHAHELARRKLVVCELEEELGRTIKSMKTVEAAHESLQQELEVLNSQHSDVSLRLASTHEEKEALLLAKLHTENVIEGLKSDNSLLVDAASKLQNEIEILKQELESLSKQIAYLNSQLMILSDEKNSLCLNHALESARREAAIVALEEELGTTKESHQNARRELEAVTLKLSIASLSLQSAHEEKEALLSGKLDAKHAIEELKSEKHSLEEALLNLQSEIRILKQDLEDSSKQIAELNNHRIILNEEIDRLTLEHSTSLSKIAESERTMSDLKNESGKNLTLANEKSEENMWLLAEHERLNAKIVAVDQLRNDLEKELSILKGENETLNVKIAEVNKQRTALEKEATVLKDENSALGSEFSSFRVQLVELETVCETLRLECTQLKDAEEKITRVNADLYEDLSTKGRQLSALSLSYAEAVGKMHIAEEQMKALNADLKSLTESKFQLTTDHEALKRESEAVILEVQESANCKALENTNLLAENETLKLSLEEIRKEMTRLNDEISVLNRRCSNAESDAVEAREVIETLTTDLQLLREAKSNLLAAVANLEQMLEQRDEDNNALSLKYMESVDQYRYVEGRVQMLSEDLEKQKIAMSQLSADYEGMKEDFIAADSRVSELEETLAAVIEEKMGLGVVNASQSRKIQEFEKLIVNHELLKDQFHESSKNAQETIMALEVQLSLSNEKLETVESDRKMNDESFKKRIDVLQEEMKKAEKEVVNSHGKVHHMECMFQQVKETLEKQLERVVNVQSEYAVVCRKLHLKILNCSNEISAVKERTSDLISKKEEFATVLKEEVGNLRAELARKVGEVDRLAKTADNYEKTVPELHMKIDELEKEMAFKDEEKREAIRQLCAQIDYHRENCKHLYQLLPQRSKGKAA